MKWFAAIRLIFRLLALFARELRAGNPYALGAVGLLVAVAVVSGFLWFARRPLGGDPEKPPISDEDFRDDANPYQQIS